MAQDSNSTNTVPEDFANNYVGPEAEDASAGVPQAFVNAARQYGRGDPVVFARALYGMYGTESNFGQNTRHVQPTTGVPSGVIGPLGLSPAVIRKYAKEGADPNTLEGSLPIAAQYLSEGMDNTGNLHDALQYYHGGPNRRLWGEYTQAYPQQVAAKAALPVPVLTHTTVTDGEKTTADFVNSVKLPSADELMGGQEPLDEEKPTVKAKPKARPSVQPWDSSAEAANGVLLGFAPEAVAGVRHLFRGEDYHTALQQQEQARDEYTKENPGSTLFLDTVGSLPAVLGGTAAAIKGVAAGANALTRVLPEAEPALNGLGRVFGGTAGAGQKGLTGLAVRTASRAGAGAVQGALAGGVTAHLSGDDFWDSAKEGAKIGALANPIVAPVAEGAIRLFTPGAAAPHSAVDPQAAKIVMDLRKSGARTQIRGGQIAQDPRVQTLDKDRVPQDVRTQQILDFHRDVSNTFGEDTDHLTPEVLDSARTRIGKVMDNLGINSTTAFDSSHVAQLRKFGTDLKANVDLTPAEKGLVSDAYDYMTNNLVANGQKISGRAYVALTRHGGPLGQLLYNRNSNVRELGESLRDILDDAAEKSNPGLASAWQDARTAYKNLRVTDKWIGNKTSIGLGDPKGLLSASRSMYPNLTKAGQLGTLAQAGKFVDSPDMTGAAKLPGSVSVKELHSGPTHALLGAAGGSAIGTGVVQLGEHAMPFLNSHPQAAIGAAMLAGGRTGLKLMEKQQINKALASPQYTTRLLHGPNGQKYFINPLLTPFTEQNGEDKK